MPSKKAEAPEQKRSVDRQGYVTIEKGGVQAKIVPSSFAVWEKKGWTEVSGEADPAKLVPSDLSKPVDEDESQEG
jgi:hypothetical protein